MHPAPSTSQELALLNCGVERKKLAKKHHIIEFGAINK